MLSEYDDHAYDDYVGEENARIKEIGESSRQLASIASDKGDIEI